jgi:hypothetical protein
MSSNLNDHLSGACSCHASCASAVLSEMTGLRALQEMVQMLYTCSRLRTGGMALSSSITSAKERRAIRLLRPLTLAVWLARRGSRH